MTDDAPMTLAEQWDDWQARGELRFQRCAQCRTWIHLPRVLCPECGSEELAWEPSSGTGTVYSWTRTHRAFNPTFGLAPPYVCAVVEVTEGVRVLTVLADAPDGDIEIGAPVKVSFEPIGDAGPPRAVFRLTGSASGG